MNKLILLATCALLSLTAGVCHAKEGKIVKGSNGTKWCCPGGKISDGCEKGANSTPAGARCNFATILAVPKLTVEPRAVGVSNELTPPKKSASEEKSLTPN